MESLVICIHPRPLLYKRHFPSITSQDLLITAYQALTEKVGKAQKKKQTNESHLSSSILRVKKNFTSGRTAEVRMAAWWCVCVCSNHLKHDNQYYSFNPLYFNPRLISLNKHTHTRASNSRSFSCWHKKWFRELLYKFEKLMRSSRAKLCGPLK